MAENKKVMIVDDSALMRRVLCDIISEIDGFEVTKSCRDGVEALQALESKQHFDVMVLDVEMPRMDGIRLLMEIQERNIKITTLMASSYTTENADITIRCMELGAVDFVAKPNNISKLKSDEYKAKLENMLLAVADSDISKLNIKRDNQGTVQDRYDAVMARVAKHEREKTEEPKTPVNPWRPPVAPGISNQIPVPAVKTAPGESNRIIALACSTGGPKSLQSVIPFLDKAMDAPCVLVQHMPVGFTKSLADRLDEISKVKVTEAVDGEVLEKGHVYIAPGGKHLEVSAEAGGVHRIRLNENPAIGGLRPCANIMYKSLVKSKYDEIVCVVLTGMGADGTEGIVELSKSKKIHVISQDEKSCIVYGMPKAIAETGLPDEILPLDRIAGAVVKYVGLCR